MAGFPSVLAFLVAGAVPLAAGPLPPRALDAALAACAPGPGSAAERIAALAAAGWVIAADSGMRRDLLALGSLIRFPRHVQSPDAATEAAFVAARDGLALPQPYPAGTAPEAAAILAPGDNPLLRGTDLEVPGADAALQFVLQFGGKAPDAALLRCTLLLAYPVPDSVLDDAVPKNADPSAIKDGGQTPGSHMRIVMVTGADGTISRLIHADLTGFPEFSNLPAKAGSPIRLSTVLNLDTRPVPVR